MVLPFYLAMTQAEINMESVLATHLAWMSCHFSSCTEGIANVPDALPENSMLILTDRENCSGHSPDLVSQQLLDMVTQLKCESILLDFQRPPNPELENMAATIVQALPCPVAVTESYASKLDCPVFLSPCPLHLPLEDFLRPWHDREIWMEAALCQETITVTMDGTHYAPVYPSQDLSGGFYHHTLHCRYHTTVYDDRIIFTLFDTPETLKAKLELAHSYGIKRSVGLWQELGYFLTGIESAECAFVSPVDPCYHKTIKDL